MGLLSVPIWTQTISKVNKADPHPPGASKLSSFQKCWTVWRHHGGSDLLREVTEKLREVPETSREVTETLREVTGKLREVTEKFRGV